MNPPPGKSTTSFVHFANCSAVPLKKSIAFTGGRFAREEDAGRGIVRCFTIGREGRWRAVTKRILTSVGRLLPSRSSLRMGYWSSPRSHEASLPCTAPGTFEAARQTSLEVRRLTHHFITFARIDQVIDTEQYTCNIFQPFRPYSHSRSEAGVQSCVDISRAVVRSRVLSR